MTRRTKTGIAGLVVIVTACALAWAVLAPPHLGRSTRYVILTGSSMEPKLRAGDLALVRSGHDPRPGDVVLYEHTRLGRHVLHRIVRVAGGRYVLKGDSNDFLDDARPSAGQIEGRLWFALPHVGSMITWTREPLHAALIVFALAFLALGGVSALSGLGRSEHRGRAGVAGARRRNAPPRAGGAARLVLAVALCGLALFALLAVVSYRQPTDHAQAATDAYAHVGTFAYGAHVGESDVYPDGVVKSGEAVFLRLVPALDVAFTYRLLAAEATDVRGTAGLTAILSDGAGWYRRIPLGEPTGFVGRVARAGGTLDLGELTRTVEEMKALTGSGTSTFALALAADVEIRGKVAGGSVRQAFAPELHLLLDPVSLRLDAADGDTSPLTVRRAETVTARVPSSLTVGALHPRVSDMRRLALLGLVLAAVVAVAAAAALMRACDGAEPSQTAALLGDRMITISRPPSVEPERVTELTDSESLQRVAERRDRMVLHWREGREHVYEVDDGGSVYRYRTGTGEDATNAEEDTLALSPASGVRGIAASR